MISVVLATHNEADHLEKTLAAVRDWVDEIIIADGASTDKTVEIAQRFGAKVIPTTNKPNFHINKQLAMDAATGDLVLQLDADEIVDDELRAYVLKTHDQLLSGQTLPAAWWIKRKNWFMGRFLKKGGQYPDPVIRLYRRGLARLPQKDVHEQMQVDGDIGMSQGHILHYGNPTFSAYLRKFNTYTSFKAQQLFDQSVNLSVFHTWKYGVWLPVTTWASLYVRHRGYVDGFAGLTFAVFSGLHHLVAYTKLWELRQKHHAST